jgi:hypothetical protein
LKWRILTLAAGLGIMEGWYSHETGAPNASHLGTGERAAKTDRSRPRSVAVNALLVTDVCPPHGISLKVEFSAGSRYTQDCPVKAR